MTVFRFLHDDSIASNLTASVLWLGLAGLWAERRIVRHLRALHRSHTELHEKINALGSAHAVTAPPPED